MNLKAIIDGLVAGVEGGFGVYSSLKADEEERKRRQLEDLYRKKLIDNIDTDNELAKRNLDLQEAAARQRRNQSRFEVLQKGGRWGTLRSTDNPEDFETVTTDEGDAYFIPTEEYRKRLAANEELRRKEAAIEAQITSMAPSVGADPNDPVYRARARAVLGGVPGTDITWMKTGKAKPWFKPTVAKPDPAADPIKAAKRARDLIMSAAQRAGLDLKEGVDPEAGVRAIYGIIASDPDYLREYAKLKITPQDIYRAVGENPWKDDAEILQGVPKEDVRRYYNDPEFRAFIRRNYRMQKMGLGSDQ